MPNLRRPPVFRHVFKLADGETLLVPQRDAQRVIDRRSDQAPPETCWDVKLPSGIVRRLWPDQIAGWEIEEIEGGSPA